MQILLEKTGKKFNTEWIFRDLSFSFEKNNACAILGRNGSGKSTLLQVIAGNIQPTSGHVKYLEDDKEISSQQIFRYLTLVAPYQELIEEFTLAEMLNFHFSFKPLMPGFTLNDVNQLLGFRNTGDKPIRLFSSGMKQRVKLVLAILSNTPVLLLDEPTINLDQAGIEWYLDLMAKFSNERIVIVCSNLRQQETAFCSASLSIEDYERK
ncbi:MAG: ABC transporter ATP-binding protein [Bacteroidetes bacterium]|nr:ABC transporter ATP-binding protein [Bacteroidota bacterium]